MKSNAVPRISALIRRRPPIFFSNQSDERIVRWGRFARAYRDRLVESRASESSLDSLRRFLTRLPCESVDDAVQLISDSARDHIPDSAACVILPPDDASNDPRIWLFEGGSVKKIMFEAGMPADVARDVLSRTPA